MSYFELTSSEKLAYFNYRRFACLTFIENQYKLNTNHR